MERIKIAFVGDIMPGGVLHATREPYISDDVLSYLKSFDLRIGTLESAIGDDFPFDEKKMKGKKSIVYSKDIDIKKLVDLGIDVVSLANNHVYDLGKEGLYHTIKLLKKHNIKYFGAGSNLLEASSPAVVDIHGKTIAFLGYCSDSTGYGYLPIATSITPGIVNLESFDYLFQISEVKKKYDYVFVIPHWGEEHTFYPPISCVKIASSMMKAGADGIFASHPHRIQPYYSYKRKPVFFSLGNFLFPDRYIQPPRPTWYPDHTINLEQLPVTYGFPYVTEHTKKLWKQVARIGMIADVEIGKNIKARCKHTNLSISNDVDFFKLPCKYQILLKFVAISIRFHFYKLILLFKRFWLFFRNKLS